MDILAHALWTNVVFYKKYRLEFRQRMIAVFFGIMPDLISFTPVFTVYILYRITNIPLFGQWRDWFFNHYTSNSYNYTHSLVFFAAAMVIVTVIRRGRQYWPMWGWALHIVIDIFSHKGFYETPFLFPLSRYKFDHGVSWGHPVFMLVNYSLLAIVYLFWFLVLRKKHNPRFANVDNPHDPHK